MTAVGLSTSTGAGISGVQHLAQSIAIILGTPIGSRVMRREFGSLLPQLLDQPDNASTRVRLYAAVAGALMRWEPRLRIGRVALLSGPTPGQITLDLSGTYVPFDGPQQLLALRVPIQQQAAS